MDNSSPLDDAALLRNLPPGRGGAVPVPPIPNPAQAVPVAAPAPRSLQVLCIDDDEQILESLKDCLAFFGHRVRVASGGKYGIELFFTAILKSEPYDVVITDLSMPDVDGYEVARQIKAESPATPVILMTGAGTQAKSTGPMPTLIDAVVDKPARMRELNDLLLRLAKLV